MKAETLAFSRAGVDLIRAGAPENAPTLARLGTCEGRLGLLAGHRSVIKRTASEGRAEIPLGRWLTRFLLDAQPEKARSVLLSRR
jgi:hypothetical protein